MSSTSGDTHCHNIPIGSEPSPYKPVSCERGEPTGRQCMNAEWWIPWKSSLCVSRTCNECGLTLFVAFLTVISWYRHLDTLFATFVYINNDPRHKGNHKITCMSTQVLSMSLKYPAHRFSLTSNNHGQIIMRPDKSLFRGWHRTEINFASVLEAGTMPLTSRMEKKHPLNLYAENNGKILNNRPPFMMQVRASLMSSLLKTRVSFAHAWNRHRTCNMPKDWQG